ncbi:hypothetical protein SCHPADRAFT_947070 [Schizopora paradoxa]|uniref:MYND-type domain-containing protein n=1 Tax=Schizopora paradoxa TaxID=27342 RepID=A0A0H2R1P7_9AGAM|nr:hypothetical protein SCHPADRAFT_947070 [Schizopora paradoxa]
MSEVSTSVDIAQVDHFKKDMPAFVEMLADIIRNQGADVEHDARGCLVMNSVDVAIFSLWDIKPSFYASHPRTRMRMLQALPALHARVESAMRWLENCCITGDEISDVREHFVKNIGRAIAIMASIGEEGMIFIKEKNVQNFAIDLWVLFRGASVIDEESLAYAVIKSRDVFLVKKIDGTFENAPLEFTKIFMGRCKDRFNFSASEVMKMSRDKLDRALRSDVSRDREDRDFHLSLQLSILYMLVVHSASTFHEFINGDCLFIVAHLCLRTQTTTSITSALENRLLQNLIYASLHYGRLEDRGRKELVALIGLIIPEALIIRDIFRRCGDMEMDINCRKRLRSDVVLGRQWEHLLQLYKERDELFNTHLPTRHDTRKCFNVECNAQEHRTRQFEDWKRHKDDCMNMRNGSTSTADNDLNAREIKGLVQLAMHQARPLVNQILDQRDAYTDVVVHVRYQDSFAPGKKGSNAKIEVTGNNDLEARAISNLKSMPCIVKITYLWNSNERTVHCKTFI